jgi:hypothetical protein
MNLEFRVNDHPEANGRIPQPGEQGWKYVFPLENGDKLYLLFGKETHDTFAQFILDELADTPSYGDGSVNWDKPPDYKH